MVSRSVYRPAFSFATRPSRSLSGRGAESILISYVSGIQQRPGLLGQFVHPALTRNRRKAAEIASVQCGYGESSQEGEILQHFGGAHDYRSQGVLGQ